MNKLFKGALIVGLLCQTTAVVEPSGANAQSKRAMQTRKVKRYACPMHPHITSTKPGKCPKCGMAVRVVPGKVESSKPESSPAPATNKGNSSSLSMRIPDVVVFDQNNNQLNFYSDLVKGKTVAINFIFTNCTAICPPDGDVSQGPAAIR